MLGFPLLMPQSVACPPAWRILYHATVSCKGPTSLDTLRFPFPTKRVALVCLLARERAVLDATVAGGWDDGQP